MNNCKRCFYGNDEFCEFLKDLRRGLICNKFKQQDTFQIEKILKGKIIKSISVDFTELGEIDINSPTELHVTLLPIIIEFEDGIKLRCLTSEWGGIQIDKETAK